VGLKMLISNKKEKKKKVFVSKKGWKSSSKVFDRQQREILFF